MAPFVIWFQHRSGSTHLVSLLNSHNEISCKGEVFGCAPNQEAPADPKKHQHWVGNIPYRRFINLFPGRVEEPSDELADRTLDQSIFDRESRDGQIFGLKIKFPSQAAVYPSVMLSLKRKKNEVKLITLTRTDFVRRAISVLNLQRLQKITDKANVKHDVDLPPWSIDTVEVIRLVKYYESIDSDFRNFGQQFPSNLTIDYDSIVNSPESVMQEIQNFLGVRRIASLNSKTRKVTSSDLRTSLENFDELLFELNKAGIDFSV